MLPVSQRYSHSNKTHNITVTNLKNLEKELGEEFEKLVAEVKPKAQEIVKKILEELQFENYSTEIKEKYMTDGLDEMDYYKKGGDNKLITNCDKFKNFLVLK